VALTVGLAVAVADGVRLVVAVGLADAVGEVLSHRPGNGMGNGQLDPDVDVAVGVAVSHNPGRGIGIGHATAGAAAGVADDLGLAWAAMMPTPAIPDASATPASATIAAR